MKFHSDIVELNLAAFALFGNLKNGAVVAVNERGCDLCRAMLKQDVPKSTVASFDRGLASFLEKAGFTDENEPTPCLANAYLHVTQRCNLSCIGCYSFNSKRNNSSDPPISALQKALHELGKAHVKSLSISGGEPFLRKDLPEIAYYAKHTCGIQFVNIISNGTAIKSSTLKSLSGTVDQISISFDGHSPESVPYIRKTQRFDQLVDAIDLIKEHQIHPHIIPTIHAKNYYDLSAHSALASRLGATINFSLLSRPHFHTNRELDDLIPCDDQLRNLADLVLEINTAGQTAPIDDSPIGKAGLSAKKSCGAGRSIISIDSEGYVYPCHMLHDSALRMGNLFTEDINRIMEKSPVAMLSKTSVEHINDCKDCSYRYLCGGGCRGRALYAGNLLAKDPYCPMNYRFFERLGEIISTENEQQTRR